MELADLNKYFKIDKPVVLPFEELKGINPLILNNDLTLYENDENTANARSLVQKGLGLVPVRRRQPVSEYEDRSIFPRRLIFEMTSRCNYSCRMCPQQNLKRPRIDIPGELYRKVIDEVDKYGIEGLWTYHLGESLLHPEFCKNLEHLNKKKNLGTIWMSTNGSLFNEDIIKCVLNSNIDFVNFSAHSVTKETYGTVAPIEQFEAVQKNLEKFYELKGTSSIKKPFLRCQMIDQETTRHEIDPFLKRHYSRADIVSINLLEYVSLPNNSFGLKQRERKPLRSCLRVTRNDCFICSNGDVTLCDAAYNGEILLGNIYEESLYDIWNGERHKNILELNKSGRMSEIEFCQKCTDYDI